MSERRGCWSARPLRRVAAGDYRSADGRVSFGRMEQCGRWFAWLDADLYPEGVYPALGEAGETLREIVAAAERAWPDGPPEDGD